MKKRCETERNMKLYVDYTKVYIERQKRERGGGRTVIGKGKTNDDVENNWKGRRGRKRDEGFCKG